MSIGKNHYDKNTQSRYMNAKKVRPPQSFSPQCRIPCSIELNRKLSIVDNLKYLKIDTQPMNHLVERCNEMQNHVSKTKEALLKDIQETLEPFTLCKFDRIFHKSPNYLQRKEKIKENVTNHKCKSSAKIQKLKSIVDYTLKDDIGKEFLSNDDVLNGEAASFLSLNKRNFGESRQSILVFKDKKKKCIPENKYNPIPEGELTKNTSLPLIRSPRPTMVLSKSTISKITTARKHEKSSIPTPVNKYIMSEMRKLWPPATDSINEKKRQILRVKIDHLQSIAEEKPSPILIEDELIGGPVNTEEKFKLDTMVHEHIRSLRKQLTLKAI
ncbi:hypothetical protein SteCoe_8163 [Stentor coeruleus]|uniref:Enkurin domain-containing protein n=1 Tax=Stentor coeruleus TaxID=5963 RepID=A0A1R2CKY5_9CILI|nr:hypothetical protein SteCoe_8163 [Stentor coeruleus]